MSICHIIALRNYQKHFSIASVGGRIYQFYCKPVFVAGIEDWYVLPADEACSQRHPVHGGQDKAGPAKQGRGVGPGQEGEEPGGHGLLLGKQGRLPHVRLISR